MVLLVVALLLVGFIGLTARGGDAPSKPSLAIAVDPDPAYTYDVVVVHITEWVWQVNQTGNTTVVPGHGWVNSTLYDRDNNVVIAQENVRLVNGSADIAHTVDPAWTSTYLDVLVVDYANNLTAHATLRTKMADRYLLYLITQGWFQTYGDLERNLRAEFDAKFLFTNLLWGFSMAILVLLMSAASLKREHRMAHDFGVPSLWDRFMDRWPFASAIPNEMPIYLDDSPGPMGTWNRLAAQESQRRRHEAAERVFKKEAEKMVKLGKLIGEGRVIY